jgi:hypothetical protein
VEAAVHLKNRKSKLIDLAPSLITVHPEILGDEFTAERRVGAPRDFHIELK